MNKINLALLFTFVSFLSACSGVQTFPNTVRAGETVSVAIGWQKSFTRSNTTVTITPSIGAPVVLLPDDPAVRAIVNLFPDPVSYLVVGREIQNDTDYQFANTYSTVINSLYTDADNDWWQTVAFIDLPISLPEGVTTIELDNGMGVTKSSVVEIISGSGAADLFNADINGPLTSNQLTSFERSPNLEVTFDGAVVPYAIEMTFTHLGEAYIVNPRESLKNIVWKETLPAVRTDDTILKVMLLPSQLQQIDNFIDFKFYIAGTVALDRIQGGTRPIQLQSVLAYDINGSPVLGVNATIAESIIR